MLSTYIQVATAILLNIMSGVVNLIKGNEVLMVFLVAGLHIVAFNVFRSARKSVK